MKKIAFMLLFVMMFVTSLVSAQCAMCTANAENGVKNGNTQAVGLNKGVLYLLSFPFILVGGVGALWYLKFRDKVEDKSNCN